MTTDSQVRSTLKALTVAILSVLISRRRPLPTIVDGVVYGIAL
jgi:hypothetical protein